MTTMVTNRYIQTLEAVLAKSKTAVHWLVIAHNDSRMVHSLSSALSRESAAILEISADTWDFEDDELSEMIEWALQQGEIRHLVLAGHSQAGGTAIQAQLVSSNMEGESHGSFNRLVAGVQRTKTHNQEAQQKFATHVQQMSQLSVVTNRWANAELAVSGLFYRAESGLFLAYDPNENIFHPLK